MKLLSFIGANGPTWGAVVGQDDVIDLGKEMPQHANLAAYIGSGDYLKAKDHVVGIDLLDVSLVSKNYLDIKVNRIPNGCIRACC